MDDRDVNYQSLQLNGSSNEDRRSTEMLPSPDALEAKQLQKTYKMLRRQASGASGDSPKSQRLENWFEDLEARRREQQKYDFLTILILLSNQICSLTSLTNVFDQTTFCC